MNIDHFVVQHDGKPVGDLISLGQGVLFYTTHPALLDLDGTGFGSVEDAEAQVMSRLAERIATPRAA